MNYSSYEFRSKKYIYFLTLHANLGALVGGMFFVALNACIWEVVKNFDDKFSESFDWALLSSAIPFGAIFGAWSSSYFAARKGRRTTLIVSDLVAIIGCLFSVSSSLGMMTFGRLICGFVAGINWTIIPLYVREISPPDLSGRSGAFFRIMFCAGMVLTFILALFLENPPTAADNMWRVIFLVPILFCIIRVVIFILSVQMDTPRYYMARDDEDNALLALAQIYKQEQVESIYRRENRFEDVRSFRDIWSGKYQRQFMIVFLLIFVDEFMGTNALSFYSTDIFLNEEKAYSKPTFFVDVRIFNVIFVTVRLGTTLIGTVLIDRIGRRPLILYGTLLTTIVGILVSISSSLHYYIQEKVLIVIFTGLQTLSLNLVLPIYSAELLPTFGIGLQVIFQMMCLLIVTWVFPFLVSINFGFMIFTAVGLFSFIPMFKLIKETKGKTLNEIYRLFHAERDSGLLDEEVVEEPFSLSPTWRY